MKPTRLVSLLALVLALAGCGDDTGNSTGDAARTDDRAAATVQQEAVQEEAGDMKQQIDDPYRWLEEVEGERALDWVREHNAKTLEVLKGDPRFDAMKSQAGEILTARDRIPYGTYRGGWVYNFWQDDTHVRGIWRRTRLASYRSDSPDWELLLDIDALAEEEDENWVWQGANCLPPDYNRCMLTLSRGGSDASVRREFDVSDKAFVEDGFVMPEAKAAAAWIDRDTLLVGTDWGEGSLTSSGYPRTVRVWKRGTPLAAAETLFEGQGDDVGTWPTVIHAPGREPLALVVRSISFFESRYFVLGDDLQPRRIPVPEDLEFKGYIDGRALLMPQKDWDITTAGGEQGIAKGTLAALDLDGFLETGELPPPRVIYSPGERSAVQEVAASREAVLVSVLDNVTGRLLKFTPPEGDAEWRAQDIAIPEQGSIGIASSNPFNDVVFLNFESFLTPSSLLRVDVDSGAVNAFKRLPDRFDTEGLVVDQHEAVSADGTRVPYFVVHREGMEFDGDNPTLLYGYGGFRIALDPDYSGVRGKLWLERGGVYVQANIRGGGEFGPGWHEAALKENRQRAYDDFIAIAEDLVDRDITRPERLGIYGGSNGGLLVGATFVQRPELFGAVVCAVPLLDMLRYHKLLAGASWIGEYGDPENPKMREAILGYSPYQNLEKDADYPKVFFVTSTEDDRVHPGHARKMAARMEAWGHPLHYFERIEGGHSASANLLQTAERMALTYVYLARRLIGMPAKS